MLPDDWPDDILDLVDDYPPPVIPASCPECLPDLDDLPPDTVLLFPNDDGPDAAA
jgi:hypothetical protein